MKQKIALLMSIVLLMMNCLPASVKAAERKYGTMRVEFSDNIGSIEIINMMTEDNHLYADAKELAARLGYQVNDSDDKYITIYNYENGSLPYRITRFFYDDMKVNHMLFFRMSEDYKAPFKCIRDDKGVWVPLEYFLLILNSSMLIVEDTLLIDMPEKKITDIFVDVMRRTSTYLFEWEKDLGYSDLDVMVTGGSSHIVNLFNGLLKFDGISWVQLFQTLALDPSAYDKKYGENMAMFLCTESDGELQALQKDIQKCQDIFSENGRIGKLFSIYSEGIDSEVDAMYTTCSNILDDIKKGNSDVAVYSRSYASLEKAIDKQVWFSKTGKAILDTQKSISDMVSPLDTMSKIAEVFQYGEEFQNQDEFSLNALEYYLQNSAEDSITSGIVKTSMEAYSENLKSNLVEYSAKRYFEENVGSWIGDAIKNGKLLGSQANMALLAWDLASGYVPFLSNGLSSADNFELALYSSVLQSDTFINYQRLRNKIFEDDSNMTAGNLYKTAQYCYLYLKSCYMTRNAALGSLEGKGQDIKQKIQPLIEEQNKINNSIAEMLVTLNKATESNDNLIYGFLPADNNAYLKNNRNGFNDLKANVEVNRRVNLNECLDNFNNMYSQIGGRLSSETGDHANWVLSDGIQYGNYMNSTLVDEVSLDSSRYSIFNIFINQNVNESKEQLVSSGWIMKEDGGGFQEYRKDNLNISVQINEQTDCLSSISFWRDAYW
ncbi:hypothetical protein IMSAGC015_00221 [Lachnospiraceae bacterium]|nr:hypothetical protein IMSAGC015_00221 [Lachnospiraceae bacterium]